MSKKTFHRELRNLEGYKLIVRKPEKNRKVIKLTSFISKLTEDLDVEKGLDKFIIEEAFENTKKRKVVFARLIKSCAQRAETLGFHILENSEEFKNTDARLWMNSLAIETFEELHRKIEKVILRKFGKRGFEEYYNLQNEYYAREG